MTDRRRSGWSDEPHRNGAHPEGMTTRPHQLGEHQDEPIDLMAVQADEELINALTSGMAVSPPGRSGYDADDRVVAMLAAWRAEVDEEPVPELVDVDTAVAAVRSSRPRGRRRHLAPLAGAAALLVMMIGGVSIGAQAANPGDTLWGVSKVLYSERAESVESAADMQGRLDRVRDALASGQTEVAARELEMAQAELPGIREEEGSSVLAQEQQRLSAKLQEAPPGTPVDPDAPPAGGPADGAGSDESSEDRGSESDGRGAGDTDSRSADDSTEAEESATPDSSPTATPEGTQEPSGSGSGTAEGSADATTSEGRGASEDSGTPSASGSASGSETGSSTPPVTS